MRFSAVKYDMAIFPSSIMSSGGKEVYRDPSHRAQPIRLPAGMNLAHFDCAETSLPSKGGPLDIAGQGGGCDEPKLEVNRE